MWATPSMDRFEFLCPLSRQPQWLLYNFDFLCRRFGFIQLPTPRTLFSILLSSAMYITGLCDLYGTALCTKGQWSDLCGCVSPEFDNNISEEGQVTGSDILLPFPPSRDSGVVRSDKDLRQQLNLQVLLSQWKIYRRSVPRTR